MAAYRKRPERFAREVLGSRWWSKQRQAAELLAGNRRVVVKSANGVGKTYLAADLALWFLYSHRPSIVLTTAPTWRQVRYLLWEEIKRRFAGARIPLQGKLRVVRLDAGNGSYALGLATDDAVKFQGFHLTNLLIIFDEASGIPDEIWEAAEGVAVGGNNKILAIGNPLKASGRFYKVFQGVPAWKKLTISALEHPNVAEGTELIPGAVTVESLEERVSEWCEEVGVNGGSNGNNDNAAVTPDSPITPITPITPMNPDVFEWRGRRYRPNNLFRARVLGTFPDSDEEALIPLRWIEAAMSRRLDAVGMKRAAADVARFGDDSTVIGVRIGPVVTRLDVTRGADTMEVAGRIARLAYDEHPESISVDSIGLGAGVVDRLYELGIDGVEAVNVGLPARDSGRFANQRAELYWNLRERFRTGDIAIPRDDALCAELAGIRYTHSSKGQIKIESKEEMKRRGQKSPDRADMLAMLFDSGGEGLEVRPVVGASRAAMLRREMANW
jgi:phage terminase large subunit